MFRFRIRRLIPCVRRILPHLRSKLKFRIKFPTAKHLSYSTPIVTICALTEYQDSEQSKIDQNISATAKANIKAGSEFIDKNFQLLIDNISKLNNDTLVYAIKNSNRFNQAFVDYILQHDRVDIIYRVAFEYRFIIHRLNQSIDEKKQKEFAEYLDKNVKFEQTREWLCI